MNEQPDPVDRALKVLRTQSWAHDAPDAKLEENLMQMVSTKPKASGSARRNVVVGALAFLLIAGVGLAATGGIDTIKGWFMATVMFEGPDGPVKISGKAVENEDGTYTITGSDGTVVSFEAADPDNPSRFVYKYPDEPPGLSIDRLGNEDGAVDFTAADGKSTGTSEAADEDK